ncbi:hypothetical protein NNJEOMEG_03641 [Fundidesulfovibrio magnetotacticus]|uniref:DUF3540 domain-containing protein n=1 Tax=Fundidesulfovibrio magnetotacticus TaxID=2730080 RepID=A0A6V8LTI4_9BACT|nr:DUF3540 domain-containing protein [Fundidesulfovibrio magnetotacticus]GFK95773.1 hypothetical protein NNJEOMEG_03641 [Fundidesulfovibrio magnetotacticus]
MSSASASPVQAPSPNLEYARVVEVGPGGITVRTGFGTIRAERAVSCLVEPRAEDLVLACVDISGRAFVLSVLESRGPVELCVEGDARLGARGGSLTLAADADIRLACPGELAAASGQLTVHAAEGRAAVERMSFLGRTFKSQVKRIRSVARSVELVFKSFTSQGLESQRFVKGHDEVQAGSRRVLVEDLNALHAKNHSVIAEEQVVMNAEQIHMG